MSSVMGRELGSEIPVFDKGSFGLSCPQIQQFDGIAKPNFGFSHNLSGLFDEFVQPMVNAIAFSQEIPE